MSSQKNNDNNSNDVVLMPFPLEIQDEMKSCYLDYALSVIIGRALPDVRDGLKPAHRRILYAMNQLHNVHNKPYMKSARIVGEVIGKYHPHGDQSVYGTMVRLAQDFSMRYTLIDGQGNFGSIDGDNAAAMRYTEVRMNKLAEEMLVDIEKETVDFRPNYDDSLEEPSLLPAKIPNLLINGSTGIAVGMATNIPPHNLTEVMDGLISLLDNPELTNFDLMKIIPGPDFPTSGSIHGIEGIRSAYLTGKGIIQVRAKSEIQVTDKSGREKIIITELPYQVIKARLIEKIAYLVNQKEIEGISDIRDESNREGIRVVVEIKKGADANVVLNKLYKQTQLQISYGIIFLAIHNNRPRLLTLKDMLQCFIDHRREIVVRKTRYDLRKAKERVHILEGLKIAVDNMDLVIEIVKGAKSPSEAKENLIQKFKLSEVQSQAILDMRLQRLTGLEQDKIIQDYKEILQETLRLEEILNSDLLVNNIIKNDFLEIKERFCDERKTSIIANIDEISIQDLIKKEEVFVTITHKGYLKRMTLDTFKSQKRGGMGVKGGDLEDDFYKDIFVVNTHSDILFFTNIGNVYILKVYDIPEASRTAKGKNIVNLLPIQKEENIRAIIPLPPIEEWSEKSLLIATEKGIIKNTSLDEYKHIKYNGIKAIKLSLGDFVIGVRIVSTQKDDDIILFSSAGMIIRFSSNDIRQLGRVSQGVKGIKLIEEEKVVGLEIVDAKSDDLDLLSISENGIGKRTKSSEYKTQSRGGRGLIAAKVTEKSGFIVKIMAVRETDELMIISDSGQVIRTRVDEISIQNRNTQGVRIIKLKEGERVVSMEKIAESIGQVEEELS